VSDQTSLAQALAKLDEAMRPSSGGSTDPARRRVAQRLAELARCEDRDLPAFAKRHMPGRAVEESGLRAARELLLAIGDIAGTGEGGPEAWEALAEVSRILERRLAEAKEAALKRKAEVEDAIAAPPSQAAPTLSQWTETPLSSTTPASSLPFAVAPLGPLPFSAPAPAPANAGPLPLTPDAAVPPPAAPPATIPPPAPVPRVDLGSTATGAVRPAATRVLPFSTASADAPVAAAIPTPPSKRPKVMQPRPELGSTSRGLDVPRGPALPFVATAAGAPAVGAIPSPPVEAPPMVSPPPALGSVSSPPEMPRKSTMLMTASAPEPALTLEQHASMTVEIALAPERAVSVLARYRLTAEDKRAVDAHWRVKIAGNPAIGDAWNRAYQAYYDWVTKRGAPP
jgi:hypothetical protein